MKTYLVAECEGKDQERQSKRMRLTTNKEMMNFWSPKSSVVEGKNIFQKVGNTVEPQLWRDEDDDGGVVEIKTDAFAC